MKASFYPSDAQELKSLIQSFRLDEPKYFSKAVIVPHAGYIYSGKLCAKGINSLRRDAKNVFIFAPAHFERFFGCITTTAKSLETPLGKIDVNFDLSKEISKLCECNTNNYVFQNEHSVDVILPLIKYFLPDAQVVPVIYGCENFKNPVKIIEHFFDSDENVFVISSDLSHFYPEREASKIDSYTAKMIEENDISNFEIEQACGAVGICALCEFAKLHNYSLIRIGMTNSSAVTGDSSRVVGYGSWFLYQGAKNDFIKKYFSDFTRKIVKEAIKANFQTYNITEYDCVFEQNGASFVTIESDGILRGCIGSIHAQRPLIKDLTDNAYSAAYGDNRFPPLSENELEKIDIKISLLSKPVRIKFNSEAELADSLVPYTDGLIIRDGNYKGVFLPEVWRMIPKKRKFLEELKQKAGLPKDYFSETFEAFKFVTTNI